MVTRTFDPVGAFQKGRLGALDIQAAEQDVARERAAAERGTRQFEQQQAIQGSTILNQSLKALRGLPVEQRQAAFESIKPQLEQFDIDLSTVQPKDLTDLGLDQGITRTQALIGQPVAGKGFTLSPGQKRFGPDDELIAEVAPTPSKGTSLQQNLIAAGLTPGSQEFRDAVLKATTKPTTVITAGAPEAPAVIPPSLIADLPEPLAQQVTDAFAVAGGGTDGLKVIARIIDKGNEQQRRLSSPKIIQTSFPKASPAELVQLQSAMDAAKTTENGLKEAGKVRTEQRRLKKAQVFQNRAIELLNNILGNDELNDVLGSVEGTDAGFVFGEKIRSDGEAEAIADIQEVESLLTADNLSLMSGVLSETDIQIIKQLAAGALIRTRGENRFIKDVTSLRDRLSSQLVQTADDTATDRQGGAQQLPPSGRQDGQLMIDAHDNKAFVFPDGTFEEVQ